MIRKAAAQDLPALARLENEAFGDDEPLCRLLLETFAGWENVWLEEQDGRPVSMALTVPVTLGGANGAYLYALATAKERRGQGHMTALIEHLKQVGRDCGWTFLCLIPAGAELAAYYAARGFEPFFYRQAYRVPIRRNLLAVAEFDDITMTVWPRLRAQLCSVPAVQLAPESIRAVLTDYYTIGGSSVRTDEAYGFFRVREGCLRFDELFARDERAAQLLLQASREKTGCEEACILAADGDLSFFGRGRRAAYGMWCLLEAPAPVHEGYLGMMLDT